MLSITTLRRKNYQIKRLNVKYVVNLYLKFLKIRLILASKINQSLKLYFT